MDLNERLLKDILGRGTFTDQSDQKTQQLFVVSLDQDFHGRGFTRPVSHHKLLISPGVHAVSSYVVENG